MLAAEVVAEARSWLGTPWRHQAYLKGVGCDCAGLVRGVGNALALFDTRDGAPGTEVFKGYGRKPEPRKMLRALDRFMLRRRGEPLPGSVLLLRFDRDPQHLAILTGEGTIVHALATVGKVVEHRLSPDWRARVVAAWEFRQRSAIGDQRSARGLMADSREHL
jgi:NlpC/P60 family putative phage cell wall peptidase